MTPLSDSTARKPDPWAATLAVLLLLLWASVLAVLLTPEISNGHGFAHEKISTMDQGGDGTRRHGPLLLVGWVFGSVLIALFVSLLTCGMARGRSANNRRRAAFIAGGMLYEGVFGMVCWSYRNSLADPQAAFSGSFPEPLSWLLFGIWLIPGFFIVLYVVFFHRWVWPPENAQRFTELIARTSHAGDPHAGDGVTE